ncbi:MAG: HD domain-containing phosphohydrolase [Planctomycetota bacterium]
MHELVKPHQVTNRTMLIVLVVGAQFVCLLSVLILFSNLTTARLQSTLRAAVLSNNQQIAEQASLFIKELKPTDFSKGSADLVKLQHLVERIKLPNNGFLCILDSKTGNILCHPNLEQMTESPADLPLFTGDKVVGIRTADGVGVAKMEDGNHLIAVHPIPEFGVRVLAHQREAGLLRAIDEILQPFLPLAYISVALVVCLTTATAFVVIGRYENRLAEANQNLEKQVEQRTISLKKTRNATIFGLAKLAESRDTDTGDHLDRIRSFVTILARGLQRTDGQMTDEFIETLGIASSLHDIGKVGIPDAVLLKPSRLDSTERLTMETHAQLGADCISAIIERLGEDDFLNLAYEIALWHHEKYDGSGYPTKLKGTEIPLSARIVALADVYDALISPRVYKRPMTHAQAREIILEGAGQHFDPRIVAAFLDSEAQFIEITTGLHARICETSPDLVADLTGSGITPAAEPAEV